MTMIGTAEDQTSFLGSARRLLITQHLRRCTMRHRLRRHRSITLHLQPIMPHRRSIGVAITKTKAMTIRRQLEMKELQLSEPFVRPPALQRSAARSRPLLVALVSGCFGQASLLWG